MRWESREGENSKIEVYVCGNWNEANKWGKIKKESDCPHALVKIQKKREIRYFKVPFVFFKSMGERESFVDGVQLMLDD